MTVHAPDDFDPNKTAGTACGLIFGDQEYDFETDSVITDPGEIADVTCLECPDAVPPLLGEALVRHTTA